MARPAYQIRLSADERAAIEAALTRNSDGSAAQTAARFIREAALARARRLAPLKNEAKA
jgi:hypothetical protein